MVKIERSKKKSVQFNLNLNLISKPVTVQCYAGYKGEERPTSFSLEGRSFQVREIVDRWYDTDSSCFKVLTEDGSSYLLRHDLNTDSWEWLQ